MKRYVIELTSDAFEDPWAIRDTQVNEDDIPARDAYYALDGVIQTFSNEAEAQAFADKLNAA